MIREGGRGASCRGRLQNEGFLEAGASRRVGGLPYGSGRLHGQESVIGRLTRPATALEYILDTTFQLCLLLFTRCSRTSTPRPSHSQLERLAEGLSHVPSVRVVALNGDTPEGRAFTREVLGVAYYPSVVTFPQHSRTFYKYKGRGRDAESLLRFLNMTCCGREDALWTLNGVPQAAAGAQVGGGGLDGTGVGVGGGGWEWAPQAAPVCSR